jgi:mRNA interferase MazF
VKRGDVITVALQGDFGKPRPALVIQSDLFQDHPSITVLPITSEQVDTPLFRLNLPANTRNGLRKDSQIIVDKSQTVSRARLGPVLGYLSREEMQYVDRALAVFLGVI